MHELDLKQVEMDELMRCCVMWALCANIGETTPAWTLCAHVPGEDGSRLATASGG